MGGTTSEVDIETEQKVNKLQFLKDKIGIPDSKVVKEMIKIDLGKTS